MSEPGFSETMICPFHDADAVCLWPVSDEDQDASFGELWNHVRRHTGFDEAETRRLMALVKIEGE